MTYPEGHLSLGKGFDEGIGSHLPSLRKKWGSESLPLCSLLNFFGQELLTGVKVMISLPCFT